MNKHYTQQHAIYLSNWMVEPITKKRKIELIGEGYVGFFYVYLEIWQLQGHRRCRSKNANMNEVGI